MNTTLPKQFFAVSTARFELEFGIQNSTQKQIAQVQSKCDLEKIKTCAYDLKQLAEISCYLDNPLDSQIYLPNHATRAIFVSRHLPGLRVLCECAAKP